MDWTLLLAFYGGSADFSAHGRSRLILAELSTWDGTTCRCGERMLMGEENLTTAGGGDLVMANNVAREMVYRCGFSARIGPVALMDNEEVYLNRGRTRSVANISTPLARVAMEEVQAVCYDLRSFPYLLCASLSQSFARLPPAAV